MYEELLMNEEGLKQTTNKMIYIGKPIEFDEALFEDQLERLRDAVDKEEQDIRPLIKEIVPTYHYGSENDGNM